MLDWLLDQGADLNRPSDPSLPGRQYFQGDNDLTLGVLNNAAASGDTELFDYLISRGDDPARSIALHHACRCSDPEKTVAMISHLVEKYHFDVNAHDNITGIT